MFSNMISLHLKDLVLVLIMVMYYYNITTVYVNVHVIKSTKKPVFDFDLDLQEIIFEIHIDYVEDCL